jgi:hypothetical protein
MPERRVEHLLVFHERLRLEQVEHRGAVPPQRPQHPLALLDVAGEAGGHRDHGLADQLRRYDGQGRCQTLDDDRHQLVRAAGEPVPVEAQHVLGLGHRPEDGTGHDLRTERN